MQDERETDEPGRAPLLWATAAVLVVLSFAWGLVPGLVDAAGRAAAAFVDHSGYAAAVLEGHEVGASVPSELHGPGATGVLYALASLAVAVGFAAVTLQGWARLPDPVVRGLEGLRRLHSGRPGDYVTWMAVGAAALAGLFAVALQ